MEEIITEKKPIHYGWFDNTNSILCGADRMATNTRDEELVTCRDCSILLIKDAEKEER